MLDSIFARLQAIGGLFHASGPDHHECIGTCFAFGQPEYFLTAAHCVLGRDPASLRVNHWGHDKLQYSPVVSVHVNEDHDLAVLQSVVETPKWIAPFERITPGVHWGQPVTSYGWPVEVLGPDARKEQLRAFRGHVQRLFSYSGRLGRSYPAAELSFAAPPGLSGAPVFLDNEPKTILGVVTENVSTYQTLEAIEERISDQESRRTEYRSVITYGVAAMLLYAVDFLEERIPGLSLLPYTPSSGA